MDTLAELLRRSGMRQVALAERVGIGKGYMSEILSGKKRPPSDTYLKILRALDLPEAEIQHAVYQYMRGEMADFYDRTKSEKPAPRFQLREANPSDYGGLDESDVTFTLNEAPGTSNESMKAKRLRNLAAFLAPHAKAVSFAVLGRDLPWYSQLAGDILLLDLNREPMHGDIVLAQMYDDASGTASTIVRSFAGDRLICHEPRNWRHMIVLPNPEIRIAATVVGSLRAPAFEL